MEVAVEGPEESYLVQQLRQQYIGLGAEVEEEVLQNKQWYFDIRSAAVPAAHTSGPVVMILEGAKK